MGLWGCLSGRVQQAEWELQKMLMKKTLPLNQVQQGLSCIPESCLVKSLGTAGNIFVLNFVNGLFLKDYTGVIETLYNVVPQD